MANAAGPQKMDTSYTVISATEYVGESWTVRAIYDAANTLDGRIRAWVGVAEDVHDQLGIDVRLMSQGRAA
jgi:hypothetical protein